MRAEREMHEDTARRIALAYRKNALEEIRRRRAARIIQEAWLEYSTAKKKLKKAAGKGK